METLCQHRVVRPPSWQCGFRARFDARLPDGSVLPVCGRHAASLASKHGSDATFTERKDQR